MSAIRTMLRRLRTSNEGATAIEYALIAALIAVACVGAMRGLGGENGGMWDDIQERVDQAM